MFENREPTFNVWLRNEEYPECFEWNGEFPTLAEARDFATHYAIDGRDGFIEMEIRLEDFGKRSD